MDTSKLSDRDLLVATYTRLDNLADDSKDHEVRLRRVERLLWVGIGLAAGAGSAIGSAAGRLLGG